MMGHLNKFSMFFKAPPINTKKKGSATVAKGESMVPNHSEVTLSYGNCHSC